MNLRMLLPLLLLTPMLSHGQLCSDPGPRPNTKNMSVSLKPKPDSPAFYYREDVGFVIFISEESLMRALSERERLGDPIIKRLAPLIRAQLPLKEDRDLYYLNLSDWLFYDSIRRVVASSIEQGDAAIVDSAGVWLSTVTVVQQRKAKIADTIIYRDSKHKSRILTLLDCIAD
jgi:hypothetical protein